MTSWSDDSDVADAGNFLTMAGMSASLPAAVQTA